MLFAINLSNLQNYNKSLKQQKKIAIFLENLANICGEFGTKKQFYHNVDTVGAGQLWR